MSLIIYDVECFSHDWLVVFRNTETGEYEVVLNDNEALKGCISKDNTYIGFNSKHYDQYIIKAIVTGKTHAEVKQVNDWIISGNQGWSCPVIQDSYFDFNNVDVRDDMQQGLSLKAIEGHLGLTVQESKIPFDLNRPLTEAEILETIEYCKHDVDVTEKIASLRKDYLQTKIDIGAMAGIDDDKAMSMTNAKLTAQLLSAKKQEYDDERDYAYPDCLNLNYIPSEVLVFFGKMQDKSISNDDLFSSKIDISIGDCPVTLGFGGIHGATPNFIWKKDGSRIIRNYDVSSYYPNLMVKLGYTSRSIPSAKLFADVLEKRMTAKEQGDKTTANALKLVTNTTYGAMLNKYNDLYDPLMGRSVCISGQLLLLELANHLYQDIPGLKVVQLNTDGIMVEFDEKYIDKVDSLNQEWQERTGFELEEDAVKIIAQKDVNNYIEVDITGNRKVKGGYLTRGISEVGAWNINHNACIVAKAIGDYFIWGTPVEQTVNECDNIFAFQFIAKAGHKYKEVHHVVGNKKIPVQRVNRVYATKNKRYGKLYKIKADSGAVVKIESLPEHCIIDNENKLTIADIDKEYYIEMAKKRICDFIGQESDDNSNQLEIQFDSTKNTKEEKSMANTSTAKEMPPDNVYRKLLRARAEFHAADIKKTGKNIQLSFKYYELDDIIPTALRIFNQIGLLPLVSFDNEFAVMTIINTDNPDETIVFTSPMRDIEPIISSKTGGEVTNAMQRLGSAETYQRRYLYMVALDVCESDSVDPKLTEAPEATKPSKPPATPKQREDVKKELTKSTGNASELQIKQLKKALKTLKEIDPSQENMIAKIAVETKGFTEITKSDCEKLTKSMSEMIEAKRED